MKRLVLVEIEIEDNVHHCHPKCQWLRVGEASCTLFEKPLKQGAEYFERNYDCLVAAPNVQVNRES